MASEIWSQSPSFEVLQEVWGPGLDPEQWGPRDAADIVSGQKRESNV